MRNASEQSGECRFAFIDSTIVAIMSMVVTHWHWHRTLSCPVHYTFDLSLLHWHWYDKCVATGLRLQPSSTRNKGKESKWNVKNCLENIQMTHKEKKWRGILTCCAVEQSPSGRSQGWRHYCPFRFHYCRTTWKKRVSENDKVVDA